MHWFYDAVRHALTAWGYWALLAGLFGESMGLPLPGETVLMFSSFLTRKQTHLQIQWVILVGIVAAVMGDNTGYLLGRHFGNTFIRWMKKLLRLDDLDVNAAKDLLERNGGKTIFFSRWIFGLRMIAGPTAGSLGMKWSRFFKFNLLGAATWVIAMAFIGYAFASEFNTLLGYIEKGAWAIAAGVLATGYLIWRRQKHRYRARHRRKAA